MPEAGQVVLAVGIDQSGGGGQLFANLVMVEHHHIQPDLARLGKGLEGNAAAIDTDEEPGPLLPQHADGRPVGAVAFNDAVRDVNAAGDADRGQIARQHRGGRGAVHVVIAENGNPGAGPDRVRDPRHGRFHVAQRRRIRHQVLDGRIEKPLCGFQRDVARGHHPRDDLRNAEALGYRQRRSALRLCQPFPPGPFAGRAGDAENTAAPVIRRSGLVDAGHMAGAASLLSRGGTCRAGCGAP